MNLDYFVKGGPLHTYCQDYVLTQNTNKLVLCDGCSACKYAEIGAKLLAHAAMNETTRELVYVCNKLKLPESCLHATLMKLEVQTINEALFTRYGDGFLAVATDKNIFVDEIKYKINAPFYLAYKLLHSEDDWYDLKNSQTRTTYRFNNKAELEGKSEFVDYGAFEENTKINLKDVKWIAIGSDGLNSFTNESGEEIPFEKIAKEIFSFKNFNGNFVKRRMQKAFKEFDRLCWKPYDDFSIGVIATC